MFVNVELRVNVELNYPIWKENINLTWFNHTYYGSKIHQTNERGMRKRTYQESYHVSYNREGNSYKFSKCKLPLKNANIRIWI